MRSVQQEANIVQQEANIVQQEANIVQQETNIRDILSTTCEIVIDCAPLKPRPDIMVQIYH